MTGKTLPFLPYGRQQITEDDIDAVGAALRGAYLTTGPLVAAFEEKLAHYLEVPEVVVCANGSAALHLSMLALDVSPGDLIAVPAVTFLATANCVRYAGAEVVFTDVDPDTGLMTPETLDVALGSAEKSSLKAVLPVHLAGNTVDMPALSEIARSHGLSIIEDACHAFGSRYGENKNDAAVGACVDSDMACFSFHPVKSLTTGEGGAITTANRQTADRLRHFRNHGLTRTPDSFRRPEMAYSPDGGVNPWYYEMHDLGYNYRLTDIQCALGISQLARFSGLAERRRALAARYDDLFADFDARVRPVQCPAYSRPTLHLYVVLIDFEKIGLSRRQFMTALSAKGIGSQVHYIPVHQQPYYVQRYGRAPELPGAEKYYQRCLSLPLFPAMTDDDVERVVGAIEDIVGNA